MIDVEGFQAYLWEEELSKNTIESYVFSLKRYAERYDEISKSNVIEFKSYLIENFKPQTINLRLSAIRRYCEYKKIPLKIKEVKEAHKTYVENVITAEQFKKLCDGLEKDGNLSWLVYVKFLAKTGMRISEALKIRKKDVLNGSVTIATKAHYRTIYFPKSLIDDMQQHLDSIDDNSKIMLNRYGKPLSSRGVSGALQRFAKRYDIPKEVMHPHSFRHFFAMEFLKRNGNIALLADLLGHGSVNVTQLYLRQSQEQQRQAIDKAVDW